ncbi:hypothetical protein Tco_1140992 [Tanacetum coccineum]
MRRQGKDFSGRVTPLFPTMVIQAQEEMGKGLAMPTDPHHTPIITQPLSSQPQRKQKSKRPKEKDTEIPQSRIFIPNCNKECLTWRIQRLLKLRRLQEDASKQGRKINDIDADEDILKNVHDAKMFDVNDLDGDEEKGDVIKEPSVPVSATSKVSTVIPTTVATTIIAVSSRPKAKGIGKGKMVEEEPVKKMSKKELLKLDEELAFKLQAEEDKEERLAREKAQRVEEANIAWDDIQAKVKADYQLA